MGHLLLHHLDQLLLVRGTSPTASKDGSAERGNLNISFAITPSKVRLRLTHRAEENAKNGKEDAAANQAWSNQLHLHRLEPAGALTEPEEGDEEAEGDHGEADVQDHVRAAASLDCPRRVLGRRQHCLRLISTKICSHTEGGESTKHKCTLGQNPKRRATQFHQAKKAQNGWDR